MKGVTFAKAKAAKEVLAAALADLPELRGIGIAVLDEGFGVKVNLSRPAKRSVPSEVDDVPVIIDIVGTIHSL
jgi:hypothetical protein